MTSTKPKSITLKTPAATGNFANYWIGLFLQIANKLRRSIIGYTSAGGFDGISPLTAIEYNNQVLNGWMSYLKEYAGDQADLYGKHMLELGPGADLGLGTIALAKGAHKYSALDVFELASGKPDEYYLAGLEHLQGSENLDPDSYSEILKQHQALRENRPDRLNYIINEDFDLSVIEENSVDCVFSNAAFQQFDDPTFTISQLSKVVKPGGIFLSSIDYTSHTRWIRDRDPLNIYRYPKWIYNLLRFRGSPNRFHTKDYVKALSDNGWVNIKAYAMESYSEEYMQKIQPSFHKPFNDKNRNMAVATIVICAENTSA